MIIFEKSGNVWFKYRDVLKALGYFDIKHTMINMKINESNKRHLSSIKQKFSDKIFKIINEQDNVIEKTNNVQMMINFNIVQKILNHIGSITFKHKVSDFVDSSLIDERLNIVWDKIKDNDVILTISNLYTYNISSSLIGLSGVATIKSQPLFVIKKTNGNILGYDIDISLDSNNLVQKNIPFSSTIYVKNEGTIIKMGMGSLKLNIHKFFKLGIKEKSDQLDAEFDFIPNAKDSEITYPTGEKSPFKLEFPIPPIKKEEIDITFGGNKRSVIIQPSNQYQITLTESLVSSLTQVKLETI